MNMKDKIKAFNQRWEIPEETEPSALFAEFKTRVLNVFRDVDKHILPHSDERFCQIFGIDYREREGHPYILIQLKSAVNEVEIYRIIEVIFSLRIHDNSRFNPRTTDYYYRQVSEAFDLSGVNAVMVEHADHGVIIVPVGEAKLDEELVNPALSFLDDSSNGHFVSALRLYQQKNWIRSAESVRRSLEEYLRKKLNNKAGLKANITALRDILKNEKSPAQIRNILNTAFSHLDQFFNENSKHNDGELDEADAEFLIYQAALLMRYIEKAIH